MKLDINTVMRGQIYLHRKNRQLYQVVSVSQNVDDNSEDKYRVEYVRLGNALFPYSRSAEQFCDGRFIRVSPEYITELLDITQRDKVT